MDIKPQNLASQASSASQDASADWQEFTATDGRRYYYNKKTKQSSWEKPLELMTPLEMADASTVWKEFTTAEGKKYYYNKNTKQSKWTIPDELKLAREQADKEASRGTQSPATLTPSTLDQLSASVSPANDVSSSPVAVTPVVSANMHSSPMAKLDNSSLHGAPNALEGVSAQDIEMATVVQGHGGDGHGNHPSGGWQQASGCASSGKKQRVGELYDGWVWPSTYQFNYVQASYHPPQARANDTFRELRPPSHPWLQFKDIDKKERQAYLNRLVEIQDYFLEPPRTIDWNVLRNAGLQAQFEGWFRTRYVADETGQVTLLPMWSRIFHLNKPVKKEWCQEFYSTLKVDLIPIENMVDDRVIHFRLGGRQRHCTVAEFGYLCGMFEKEEFEDGVVPLFLAGGEVNISSFSDGMHFNEYWHQISKKGHFSTGVSKVSDIRSKRLRLLHKMITYSFLHRGNQNDKVYSEDLWLLRQFTEFGSDDYVCAPYILARHMQKHRERRYLCGHFITSMVERLGRDRVQEGLRWITEEKPTSIIDRTELRKARLMGTYDESLASEDEERPRQRQRVDPQGPPQMQQPPPNIPSSFNFSSMEAMLNQILGYQTRLQDTQDMILDHQRSMGSQVNRLAYQQEYWAPHINQWVQTQRPDVRPYSPPDIFMPASTTYGFFYPPRDQAAPPAPPDTSVGAGTSRASGSGGEMPQFGTYRHTQGDRYSGPAYDYYGSDFFSAPHDDDDGGGGVPSILDMDEE